MAKFPPGPKPRATAPLAGPKPRPTAPLGPKPRASGESQAALPPPSPAALPAPSRPSVSGRTGLHAPIRGATGSHAPIRGATGSHTPIRKEETKASSKGIPTPTPRATAAPPSAPPPPEKKSLSAVSKAPAIQKTPKATPPPAEKEAKGKEEPSEKGKTLPPRKADSLRISGRGVACPPSVKARGEKATVEKKGKVASSKKVSGVKAGEGEEESAEAQEGQKKGKVRLGLWVKFTAPVALIIIAVISGISIYLTRETKKTIINSIVTDGISNAAMLSEFAYPIVAHVLGGEATYFLQHGWIQEGDLEQYKTFPDPATIADPVKQVEIRGKRSTVLRNLLMDRQILRPVVSLRNAKGEPVQNEILGAIVTTTDEKVIAASFELAKLKIEYANPWLAERIDEVRIGENTIRLADVEIEARAAFLMLGDVRKKVLQFETPIRSKEERKEIAKVRLWLTAETVETEVGKLNMMMLLVGGFSIILAIGTCLLIAWKVTEPIHILIHDMSIVAQGDLAHKTHARSNDEIGKIAEEFNAMTHRLYIAQKKEKDRQRIENELNVAREIQHRLLPERLPQLRGFDMHAVYIPAKEMGGDYYDMFPVDPTRLGICVADVSGKGVGASLVMTITRTILHLIAWGKTSTAETLSATNRGIAPDIKRGMFVTAFYVILDARAKTLLCSSAGHNPMVLMRATGELELINPGGIALGFDKGPIFDRTIKEQMVQLQSGDRVVLYTDGVVESMNIKNEEYTDERFYAFVRAHHDLESKAFVEALLADLDRHKGKADQHDDITIVTFRVL